MPKGSLISSLLDFLFLGCHCCSGLVMSGGQGVSLVFFLDTQWSSLLEQLPGLLRDAHQCVTVVVFVID